MALETPAKTGSTQMIPDYQALVALPFGERVSMLQQTVTTNDRSAFEKISASFNYKDEPQVRILIAGAIQIGHVSYLPYLQSQIHGMDLTEGDVHEQVACMKNRVRLMEDAGEQDDGEFNKTALNATTALWEEALARHIEPRMLLLERQAKAEHAAEQARRTTPVEEVA